MDIAIDPQWQQLALYAVGAALVLIVLFNIPFIGRALRALFSFALFAFCLFLLFSQMSFQPGLSDLTRKLGLDSQQVTGDTVRIRMSPDGHFWASATLNGHPHRMLIDSGATITAISSDTAAASGIEAGTPLTPIVMRTANGAIPVKTGTIDTLKLGSIEASDLKVAISPSLGDIDVLGMNFLSQLQSWRVEGRTLILVPEKRGADPTDVTKG